MQNSFQVLVVIVPLIILNLNHYRVGGKSSVLLDVKPWDDETDMKKLEEAVRSIEMEGLFWGACMVFSFHLTYCFAFPE